MKHVLMLKFVNRLMEVAIVKFLQIFTQDEALLKADKQVYCL